MKKLHGGANLELLNRNNMIMDDYRLLVDCEILFFRCTDCFWFYRILDIIVKFFLNDQKYISQAYKKSIK